MTNKREGGRWGWGRERERDFVSSSSSHKGDLPKYPCVIYMYYHEVKDKVNKVI